MRPHLHIGSDHAGFKLKEHLRKYLLEHGYDVHDCGAYELDLEDDYPQFAACVAHGVAKRHALGILLCGNAEGVCIAANKVDGARAAVGYSVYAARTTREDDDANIICLPGRVLKRADAERIMMTFLTTPFSGAERHKRRIKQIKRIERET